mmetsp:Transcript_23417/g.58577  ORF Transcript_23417/g.58577 Transcript_23417/m.58577 type:complete len:218 (-) Transcript_23417:25-678(-)|eukprot:CAMPEP_0177635290 /NCGR_PEP_ID=MMETSP0447-20121125/3822_1 /TAXON_ID=0 /ORGANISM="Stygamoeba regulata, Strain BSH-02190019" /LENGTH=217 /DNA_ID=CAMNT_0019137067 /DNA_START=148 /DNA_END=798 /DNA_ORIENTATION=+
MTPSTDDAGNAVIVVGADTPLGTCLVSRMLLHPSHEDVSFFLLAGAAGGCLTEELQNSPRVTVLPTDDKNPWEEIKSRVVQAVVYLPGVVSTLPHTDVKTLSLHLQTALKKNYCEPASCLHALLPTLSESRGRFLAVVPGRSEVTDPNNDSINNSAHIQASFRALESLLLTVQKENTTMSTAVLEVPSSLTSITDEDNPELKAASENILKALGWQCN